MTGVDFESAYRAYHPQIIKISRRVHLAGMDADDIASEMTIALWKAAETYDPAKGSFTGYWWSLWLNRRNDLIESVTAKKRGLPVLVPQVPDRGFWDTLPLDIPDGTPLQQMVWRLLAAGEPGVQVRSLTNLTRRAYYALIDSWRTDDIRDRLGAG